MQRDTRVLRRQGKGLRHVQVAQDVEQNGSVTMSGRQIGQIETGDLRLEECRVESHPGHIAVGGNRRSDARNLIDLPERQDRPADVPHPHTVERLAEQHEPPLDLDLLSLIPAPCGRSDSSGTKVRAHAAFRLQYIL